MTIIEKIASAIHITNVEKIDTLTEDYYRQDGKYFRLCLVPKPLPEPGEGEPDTRVKKGDIMVIVAGTTPRESINFEYVEVPVEVGYWTPTLFSAIRSADDIDSFSTEEDYKVGDIVIYSDVAYKFIKSHDAGAWSSSDVEVYPLLDLTKVDAYAAAVND